MLKHLTLKDFVIVSQLELAFHAGFSVLTGETGAGKSILIDALQLVLGARAESHWCARRGPRRGDRRVRSPPSLAAWLDEAGFAAEDTLLLRRIIDSQGKSRGFINGSAATAAQLREVADHLVDIHGQHAWQGLTRPAAVRALLDEQAGVDPRPWPRPMPTGRPPPRPWPPPARWRASGPANASACSGRSARSTAWRPAPRNGPSSMPSTSASRMARP
jgi:DNA repair protein RecN (Recombination protein N)